MKKEKDEDIQAQLDFYEKKAKDKLQKRLLGEDVNPQDQPETPGKPTMQRPDFKSGQVKKREIKAWRKEMRKLKKEAKEKNRQQLIASGQLVEP